MLGWLQFGCGTCVMSLLKRKREGMIVSVRAFILRKTRCAARGAGDVQQHYLNVQQEHW
jgi:hypothetical protein